MSAHYGYFDIGVYKNDGTLDEAKAREVFAWIQTNCPWFYDENVEVFVLDGHRISNNSDFFCDGLYQVKDGDVPDNLDFLDDAYKAVKAEKIAATFLYDGSETSWLLYGKRVGGRQAHGHIPQQEGFKGFGYIRFP